MRDIKKTKDIEERFIKETKLTKEHKKGKLLLQMTLIYLYISILIQNY